MSVQENVKKKFHSIIDVKKKVEACPKVGE
jgi:hypothetical protein